MRIFLRESPRQGGAGTAVLRLLEVVGRAGEVGTVRSVIAIAVVPDVPGAILVHLQEDAFIALLVVVAPEAAVTRGVVRRHQGYANKNVTRS